ncbi:MAG: AAA family ATPase [Saccharofermentans sp.]|nr:AAA family ATPase [Saccharofermentans sp.]
MARVFFGKMNIPAQTEEKVYRTADRGFLGDIQIGDYAFIKLEKETQPATVKRLWKLNDIQEIDGEFVASFDEISQFDPIQLLQFEALDLFVLDMNLLNKCNKQTKGLSFYNISLTDEALFDSLASSPDQLVKYLADSNHYRKMVRVESKELLASDTIDIQFYKEGESWLLADAKCIGDDLKDNYDASQFDLFDKYGKKGTNTAKDKMYSFLAGTDVNVPMMGLWDLFCGTVKENTETKKQKKTSNKRDDFIEYCKANGVVRAASVYESGIRSMESEMSENIDAEFDKDKCKALLSRVDAYVKTVDESRIGNRRNWIHYVNKYVEYKNSLDGASSSSSGASEDAPTTYTSYDYSLAKHSGINKVFYGTPGCGKSYYVETVVLAQEEIDENSVFRTTFFQDYSNTDFVGQILPKVDADGNVTYEFNPGPFTLALKCAIDNPDEKVALIIEELNRGNAPSIFGDIFQLLDRQDGTSRYSIINVNVQTYLKKESLYDLGYIKIPANMYIYATMNTSDQNVFTLDTAFKRRWKFEKLTNEFLGKDTIGGKLVPGLQDVTWRMFVETVNKYIISHATSLSAEDKQLGKYFVDDDLLMDSVDDYSEDKLKEFAYKVFEYLWADVAKFNRTDWFIGEVKSLDILIYKFMNHENVFVPGLASEFPVYDPTEDEE